jgi:hypothetical protein
MAREEERVAAMSWTHCAECPNVQECAEADCCMNEHRAKEAEKAEERRKLLAEPVDRGITDIVARLTRWISMADVNNDEVEVIFVTQSDRDTAMLCAAFKRDIRNHDLIADVMGQGGDFQSGVRFMGLRLRVAKDPRRPYGG